jgi:site-specific DNA-methyltransferase (cytosine-N4-specific)
LISENSGDRKALSEAIRSEFYSHRSIPPKGQGTVWQNVTSGMVAYGIIDDEAQFTTLGAELYKLRSDEDALYRTFAKHLLVNVNGIALIETLLDMQRAGEVPTLPAIREALEERGIHTSTAGKSISLLRGWLSLAKLFSSQWVPNTTIYEELLEHTEPEIAALANLNRSQKAVLKMLAELGAGHYDSSDLRKVTVKTFGVDLNEKQFPKNVLYPLRDLGYVQLTKKGGRGWTLDVEPTSKLQDEVTIPLLDQLGDLDPKLRSLIRMSVSDIVSKLDKDKHQKGLALEALGFKFMRILGLSYLNTRFRPKPGRFEVDLLFHSDRLAYSRWQIQCKNTDRVSVDDVAKEVGLTYYLLSNVIVILTRGVIGEDARRYANDVMRKTNLAIVLIDRADVDDIVENPLRIFNVLQREAAAALELKPLETQRAVSSQPEHEN